MKIIRRFTQAGQNVYDLFEYTLRSSVLRNPDGSVVFEMHDIEVPKGWSQVATDIMAQKYFRKAGVPQLDAEGNPQTDESGNPVAGGERSAKQVVHRLAGCWTQWGKDHGYFDTEEDAQAFYDENAYILLAQMAAPNSPQWFNTGLNYAYGITGPSQGHYYVDPVTGKLTKSKDAYTHPQPHACARGNTRLFTSAGVLTIREIVENHRTDITVFDGNRLVPIYAVKNNGVRPVWRATLRNGNFIEFTDDHQIWSADRPTKEGGAFDWKPLREILGWQVQQAAMPIAEQKEEENEVLAVVAGEQSLNSTAIELRHILRNAEIEFSDDAFSNNNDDFVQEYELDTTSYTAKIPEKIFQGTLEEKRLFLRSLFQASGSVQIHEGKNSGDVVLSTISEELAHGVQILLLSVGIYSNASVGFDAQEGRKPVYQISISYFSERMKYEQLIGFISSDKQQKLRTLNATIFGEQKNSLSEELVTSIEYLGEEEVFDIQTESARFAANGVVVHNCFIQSVSDDLVNEGGIFDLITREARIFKYGSGTGSNFSAIRAEGEPLSGGGVSSGLMSFLKVADRAAGAVKSGGTTRRAAKMVILNADHPDIETFIDWKMQEEQKVADLVAGSKVNSLFLNEIMQVAARDGSDFTEPGTELHDLVQRALNRGIPMSQIMRALALVGQGHTNADVRTYNTHYEGEAYITVSGQNSNNSVRVTNSFMDAVEQDGTWDLVRRTDGKTVRSIGARQLWQKINYAAWSCADPGLQFHTTVNEWHTSPKDGEINGSNPCSEYMFLDDTACNLASINLAKFYDAEARVFDVEGYKHACRILTIVLEVSVLMAQFPSKTIAQKSYDFRTLGLGYANIGTVLMTAGIPYDSEEGRAWAGALSAIMTGEAYAASAEMAGQLGPFPNYKRNEKDMLRVIRNHRRAAYNAPEYEYEGLTIKPMGINHSLCPTNLSDAAKETWDRALALGEQHGYRNAQVSVIAPTGCLVGGSLVTTSRGIVPLETLGDTNGQQWQDISFTVLTDEGEKEATKFYINGIAPTRTIRTSSGYEITGTLQHRVKVVDTATGAWKWKRFSEITSGDILPLSMNTTVGKPQPVRLPLLSDLHWNCSHTMTVPETMTPELAELVGYFMGDGSLHSKGLRFCVTKEDTDVAHRLIELVSTLFNLECYVDPRQGYLEVGVNSVQLTHWWQASGFNKLQPTANHSGKGWTPRIPNAVLYTNDPVCYGAFLRGLFEADGTVTNGVPHWSSVRKSFSTQVKSLLLALGIPTTTKLDQSQWGSSTLYVVRLLNQSYNSVFQEQIGFIGARKRNAVRVVETVQSARHDYIYAEQGVIDLALAQPSERNAVMLAVKRHGAITRTSLERVYKQTGNTEVAKALDYYYDVVEANEDGGEQLTYDISVPENVTYVANGFISHNTIALIMDCDTTGIEPDFAMVKFKKLAGGGYFKIVNSSVPAALRALGYSEAEIVEIERYIKGHGTLSGCPHINKQSLKEHGFSDEKIQAIENQLDSVFDVKFAFNKWTLGEEFLRGIGFAQAELDDPSLNILARLGFTSQQIEDANKFICGTMTIEGAPGLNAEHLPVFDCANKCGKYGQRYIQHMGHVKMMAAAQPFISGAISKTINMPNHATIDEVAHVYMESWKLMLKAIALYRDGSKLSQPLNSTADTDLVEEVTLRDLQVEPSQMIGEENTWDENVGAAQVHERIVEKVYHRADRRRLPKRRHGFVREATVGGHKVFIRTGEYEDGTLGEIFIDMYKEGASFKGLLNCFAVLASKALQYGMPLEKMVDTFTFTRFEPSGPVFGHEAIKSSTSIIDYVFRALGYEYLGREDFIHVKAIDETASTEAKAGTNGTKANGNGNGNGHGNGPKLSPGQSLYARQVRAIDTPTVAPPVKPMGESQKKVQTAKAQGYTGEQCGNCGSMRVRQNGTCHVCEDCGTTSGCS
ncbi:MAG: adenosylcobalamin-dependent ribonucleoside-diphosphate reductase [Chlorobi bacterium]|nr:adenosylcobalamin-dependent ribonucleoside-diphosphate reductase [Chlorobiota bacterium]